MAKRYSENFEIELKNEYAELERRFLEFKKNGKKLNISRGVPSKAQLDLSQEMLCCLKCPEDYFDEGTDTRNYGFPDGLPSAKSFFAPLLGAPEEQIIVGGNSSLNMMYDMVIRGLCFGFAGQSPWSKQGKIKFICVVPGYDRHFTICEQCGIEMVTVCMTSEGPDMDAIEQIISDPAVKGIWCVPKYSNPDGTIYSPETIQRFAKLKPAAPDFRIFWDNAYCVHALYEEESIPSILELSKEAGNDNLAFVFTSTSKISFAGSGISAMAASPDDIMHIKKLLSVQSICPDKTNQLRHVRFFKDRELLQEHMRKHANIIRPKFETVLEMLEHETDGLPFVKWSKPKGGYFISLDVLQGTAKRTIELAQEAGVTLTPAGSTWPYRKDPKDNNIRIAPTYPERDDIQKAAELLCICLKLAAIEKLNNS